jgi:Cof subfamily protein (haloacid dehalogenase superfamily)
MTIRAICTDIDGTLLDNQRELSARTIACISKIKSDVPVILASSRMPAAMRHLQKQLNILDHSIIAFNGGLVLFYDINESQARVLDSVTIPVQLCKEINAIAKSTSINVSIYNHDHWYAPAQDYWTEREEKITKVKSIIADIASTLDHWEEKRLGAHKIMCMGPEAEIHKMDLELNTLYGDQIYIYRSRPTYLELAPKSISKATALKLVLQYYDILPSSAMAFGDNYNDVDLLKSVGLGIAVANAIPEVKAVANEITLKSVDDGVAIAIEKYFF